MSTLLQAFEKVCNSSALSTPYNNSKSCEQLCTTDAEEKVPLLKRMFPNGYKNEAKKLILLAIPTILTQWFQFMTQSISVMMCGHLSRKDLDAVALANSIINLTGISIGMGLTSACDTFFSQTYGSGNKKRMGLHLQRSFMIINLFLFPIIVFQLNIKPILHQLLGQDEEIAEKAATYVALFLPGLFFNFNFEILARYLQNQNVVYPPMICAFVANIFNAFSQFVTIHVFGYGFKASAICQASCMFVMFILLVIYVLVSGVTHPTWAGWTIESFYDWKDFLKLALPGIFLVGLEIWFYESILFLAGLLNDIQMGVQSVLFQISVNNYMIPLGLAMAVQIRVGQQVGEFNIDGAITSYRVALTFICIASFFTAILFLTLANYIPRIFASDKHVVEIAAKIIPIFTFYQFIDGVNICSLGVLRGCGQQLFGASIVFITYYVIALPIAIPVTLWSGLQIQGAWFVLFSVAFCEAILLLTVIYFQNWNHFCLEAQKRVKGHSVEEETKIVTLFPSSESQTFCDEKSALNEFYESSSSFATYDASKFRQVFCYRSLILIFCTSLLVAGVILRITLPSFSHNRTDLYMPLLSNLTRENY